MLHAYDSYGEAIVEDSSIIVATRSPYAACAVKHNEHSGDKGKRFCTALQTLSPSTSAGISPMNSGLMTAMSANGHPAGSWSIPRAIHDVKSMTIWRFRYRLPRIALWTQFAARAAKMHRIDTLVRKLLQSPNCETILCHLGTPEQKTRFCQHARWLTHA